MRGNDEQTGWMFSYVSPEDRVPADHPLRTIRRITDRALGRLSTQFDTLYIKFGRPSVPPEKLLRVSIAITSRRRLSSAISSPRKATVRPREYAIAHLGGRIPFGDASNQLEGRPPRPTTVMPSATTPDQAACRS